jgi:magnesium transporter
MAMPAPTSAPRSSVPDAGDGSTFGAPATKKKRHRAGKNRKKNRRQSFVAPSEADETPAEGDQRPSLRPQPNGRQQNSSFYRVHDNKSNTSLESQALLDVAGVCRADSADQAYKVGDSSIATLRPLGRTPAVHQGSE